MTDSEYMARYCSNAAKQLRALLQDSYASTVGPSMEIIVAVAKESRLTILQAFEKECEPLLSGEDLAAVKLLSAAVFELYALGYRGHIN